MTRRLIAFYENGNYTVRLYSDGTKVKRTEEDEFLADFPDSIDLKITDRCDLGCPMCHECSSPEGAEGALDARFLDTLQPGTELAIGGGNPLSHLGLVPFLEKMRARGIVCNLTVNGEHLLRERELVESLLRRKLIWGLGVSITRASEEVISFAEEHKNTVLHLIAGVFEDYEALYARGLKILILGYKRFGRGEKFYNTRVAGNIDLLKACLPIIVDKFECVSFDNLALSQLDVKSIITQEEFDSMFMGNDGEGSMYIDLPRREFARSSTSTARYPLSDDIRDMFGKIRT